MLTTLLRHTSTALLEETSGTKTLSQLLHSEAINSLQKSCQLKSPAADLASLDHVYEESLSLIC
jgi:hypothetical protein